LILWYFNYCNPKVAVLGQTKSDEDITEKYRESTEAAVALWSESRIDLVEGNSGLTIPVETEKAILESFDVLDSINALLNPDSGVNRVLTGARFVQELLGLAKSSSEYLTRMNAITDDYQTISDDRISNLVVVEIIVL
jgi:hypothetical protein